MPNSSSLPSSHYPNDSSDSLSSLASSSSPSSVVTPAVVVASVSIRLVGSISYALLSSMSILMNWLLITVLYYGHYQFRRMAFFTLAWQMIVCDLMTQTVQMIVAVPITFAGEAVYGHPFWYYAVLFFDTVAYNATLNFSALLTFNRLCVFFFPLLNDWFFSYPNIFWTVAILWLYVFLFCSCYIMIGCRKNFSETGFFMYHDCPEHLSPAGILFRQTSSILSTYLPVVMLLSYLLIFVYVRYFVPYPKKSSPPPPPPLATGGVEKFCPKTAEKMAQEYAAQLKRTQEIKFLIQSFLICGFLEIQNLAFDWAPSIFSSLQDQWSFLVTFCENWISILLNSISPIILFSFNIDVRKCFRQLFRHFFLLIFAANANTKRSANSSPPPPHIVVHVHQQHQQQQHFSPLQATSQMPPIVVGQPLTAPIHHEQQTRSGAATLQQPQHQQRPPFRAVTKVVG